MEEGRRNWEDFKLPGIGASSESGDSTQSGLSENVASSPVAGHLLVSLHRAGPPSAQKNQTGDRSLDLPGGGSRKHYSVLRTNAGSMP